MPGLLNGCVRTKTHGLTCHAGRLEAVRLLDRLSEASELAQSGAQGDVVGRLAPLLLAPSSIATGLPAGPDRLQALKLLQVRQIGTTSKPQLGLPSYRP